MWKELGKRQKVNHLLMLLFGVFPIKHNKIVVESYFGKGYGDNAKYIVEKLKEKNDAYDIIWLVDEKYMDSIPTHIQAVNRNSIKALYHLATSKVWIDNCRKSVYTVKRKGQFYIQTWHGALGVKKCEGDAENSLTKEYVRNCKHDSKMADVILTGSRWGTELVKRAFWFDGRILEIGSPRNDVFFKDCQEIKSKVDKALKLEGTQTILYAPTFRNDGSLCAYILDFKRIREAVEQKFGGKFKVLIRLHPNVSRLACNLNVSEDIINATDYPDMQELLLASDILITDYSSTMSEFMLKKKPVFLTALDYNDFISKERELYFDLAKLPFPLCLTMNELIDSISAFDNEHYVEEIESFSEKIGQVEKGIASEKVAELIEDICYGR